MSATYDDIRHIATRFSVFLGLLDKGYEGPGMTKYYIEESDLDITASPELDAALTRKALAEARIAEAKAQEASMQLKNIKASNDYNRELYISGPILDTDEISNVLQRWSRRDPGKPITIYLNTPGGSVFDGNALGYTIEQLRGRGHKVTIHGLGTVMSFGAVLLQYADERVLAKETVFMVHSLSGGLHGALESLEDTTALYKRVNERLLDKLTERTKISKAALKKKVARKELFLTADEALEFGFCDRVE